MINWIIDGMCGRVIFTESELFIINYIHSRREDVKPIISKILPNIGIADTGQWSIIIKQFGISFFYIGVIFPTLRTSGNVPSSINLIKNPDKCPEM